LFSAYNVNRHRTGPRYGVDELAQVVKSRMIYALGRSSGEVRRMCAERPWKVGRKAGHMDASIGSVVFTFNKRALAMASLETPKEKRRKKDAKRTKAMA